MMGNRWASLLTVMVFVLAAPVEAAQPLVTDDAAVLAPKTCQLKHGLVQRTMDVLTGPSRRAISRATWS